MNLIKKLFAPSAEAVITAIHNEVDTAQDRILAEAKQIIATSVIKEQLNADKEIKLLEELGFANSKKVRELKEKNALIQQQNASVETALNHAQVNANLIINYSVKYPQYKFITHDVINYLMNKYDLSIGPISAYMGEIPVKNLLELKRGKAIEDADINKLAVFVKLHRLDTYYAESSSYSAPEQLIKILTKGVVGNKNTTYDLNNRSRLVHDHFICSNFSQFKPEGMRQLMDSEYKIVNFNQDFIIAPVNHFDEKEMSKHTSITKKDDPVVGTFVKGGALVKTKWGLEANDPELLNEIEN